LSEFEYLTGTNLNINFLNIKAKLYDYIKKSDWSKEELKNFKISDELDYGNQQMN